MRAIGLDLPAQLRDVHLEQVRGIEGGHSLAGYIEYFARCVAGGQIPLPDLREGIVTVALMTAMERSLETKQPASVPAVLREFGLQS